MNLLAKSFPRSVHVLDKGAVVEFCPDGTCDGFVGSGVSATTLADITFLYVYFFSDYVYLSDWRRGREPSLVADHILAKPEHRACRRSSSKEAASCVLGGLYGRKKFTAIAVRYDEGGRSVTPMDLTGFFGSNQ